MQKVFVTGPFDDMRSRQYRFLYEASKLGPVHVCLWSDEAILARTGRAPKFPLAERRYLVEAIRFVAGVSASGPEVDPDALPAACGPAGAWAVDSAQDNDAKRSFCRANGFAHRVVSEADLASFPVLPPCPPRPGAPTVIVTGCYDWFHSGHVRFFEEVSELGNLHVVLGSDANVELLKGPGHPMFREQERRFIVGSIRHVTQSHISTGAGWLDAEPEIQKIKPDIYAVNEDGDKPEKRDYCAANGIRYVVLKRLPKPGLPRRQSTDLRGF